MRVFLSPVTDSFSQMWLYYMFMECAHNTNSYKLQHVTRSEPITTCIVFVYTYKPTEASYCWWPLFHPSSFGTLSPSPSLITEKRTVWPSYCGCMDAIIIVHLSSPSFPKWFGNSWNTRQLISRQHFSQCRCLPGLLVLNAPNKCNNICCLKCWTQFCLGGRGCNGAKWNGRTGVE